MINRTLGCCGKKTEFPWCLYITNSDEHRAMMSFFVPDNQNRAPCSHSRARAEDLPLPCIGTGPNMQREKRSKLTEFSSFPDSMKITGRLF
jgi:hypothetical protein